MFVISSGILDLHLSYDDGGGDVDDDDDDSDDEKRRIRRGNRRGICLQY